MSSTGSQACIYSVRLQEHVVTVIIWLTVNGVLYGVFTMAESDTETETVTGFPLGLENLEKWEGIFQSGKSQGILNKLEKSGKTTQNTGKLREFQKKLFVLYQ